MAVATTLTGSAVLKVGVAKVSAVDYTDQCSSVVMTAMREELDASSFGSAIRYRVGGLQDYTVTATLLANATVVNALLLLLGSNVFVAARRSSAAISATNPEYEITGAYFASLDVVNQSVGELSEIELVFSGGSLFEADTTP